jgi:hypothetical protein
MAVAFTFRAPAGKDGTRWIAVEHQNSGFFDISDFSAIDGTVGEIFFNMSDGSRIVSAETQKSFTDGDLHLVVINKFTDTNPSTNIDIYVDDMSFSRPFDNVRDQGFDHTSYSANTKMGFFAQKDPNVVQDFKQFDATFFEFLADGTYSQTQRNELKTRVAAI